MRQKSAKDGSYVQNSFIVAKNMKRLRQEKGWSQRILALKTGYSLDWIEKIEFGKSAPSLGTVLVLARTFDVPLWELFIDDQLSGEYEKRMLDFARRQNLTPEQIERWISVGKLMFKGEKNV